jgi:hypothetical protein
VPHKPDIHKDIVLGIREIARQTALIRQQFPSLSTCDVFDAIGWTDGKPVQTANMLNRMHRQRSRAPDYPLPRK